MLKVWLAEMDAVLVVSLQRGALLGVHFRLVGLPFTKTVKVLLTGRPFSTKMKSWSSVAALKKVAVTVFSVAEAPSSPIPRKQGRFAQRPLTD
jgi:hypothetical protein